MCGAKEISIHFAPVDANGKFKVNHPFMVMGGLRQAGDSVSFDPFKASLLFIDANKKHFLHQAWIGKVYNMAVASMVCNRLNDDNTLADSSYSAAIGGDILPIRLMQYVPENEFLPEGEYAVSDFFITHASIISVPVARCMKKP